MQKAGLRKPDARWVKENVGSRGGKMPMRELILVGLGGIIGAGFFLGSGLPIHTAGPSVLIAFVIGALITAQVVGALTSVAGGHPVKGSFQVYANMYMGHYAGFLQGWIYYLSSVLTIASESVAMAIFASLWVPGIPTWLMASVFSLIVLVINAFGIRNFSRFESWMSVVKLAALVGFIVVGILMVLGLFTHTGAPAAGLHPARATGTGWFPHGMSGLAQSMLVVIFAYSGIGVFGTAMAELRNPRKIDLGATITMTSLTVLYLASIALVLLLIPWQSVSTKTSPFVMALRSAGIPVFGDVLNGAILIASFSVMAGSVFSANQILSSLGRASEAPGWTTKNFKNGTEIGALCTTTVAVGITIVLAFLLPANVYNVLISASGFFTFLNWIIILITFFQWRRKHRTESVSKLAFGQPFSTGLTLLCILVLAGYALLQHDQRIGFYAAIAMMALVSLGFLVMRLRRAT